MLAYSKWKFPRLPVSERWNDILAHDINANTYPTLAQIDAAVESAKAAVAAYSAENAEWFATGTDYVTKSLGFVDHTFRKMHPFAQRTRDAFRKYENLLLPRK